MNIVQVNYIRLDIIKTLQQLTRRKGRVESVSTGKPVQQSMSFTSELVGELPFTLVLGGAPSAPEHI